VPRRLQSARSGSGHLRPPVGLTAVAVLAVTAGTLTACSSSSTKGYLGLALDPAGRLVAVVAVCEGELLGSLTLTDTTTGTSVTARPAQSPEFGGTVLLTGPVGSPRPEGALDLLDRDHEYTLAGSTAKADSDESTGELAPLRFKLDAVVREGKLKQGHVLARDPDNDGGALVITRDEFIARATRDC
jgi:hypothetical protein